MTNIKSAIAAHVHEIIDDMNQELINDRLIRFWRKVGSHLTLDELVQTYWSDTKSEFGVDLGTSFGKIFELYLPFKLQELGYDVSPLFSSKGDMVEMVDGKEVYWELKTGTGSNIQGSTHSPKERATLNLIQVLWTPNRELTLDEILASGSFIQDINICVFTETTVNSVGVGSSTNSRTSFKFTSDRLDECEEACVFGEIKPNRVNIKFVKTPIN